ncbi:MAG: LamG domain-containing protein [Spirochaetia bacterium]|nr:LamG domain-containing protein [Spirochaetia bacterium]
MKRIYTITNIIFMTFSVLLLAINTSSCSNPSGGGSSTAGNSGNTGTEDTSTAVEEYGIVTDPVNGIAAGLSLDGNITAESNAVINGGIEWVPGISGQGIRMDTDGEFISLPDSDAIDLIGEGSVEVWVYPEAYTSFAGILHKGVELDFSDEAYSLQYWTSYFPSMLLYNEAGSSKQITASSALSLLTWHHLAATWDETEFSFYVDGVLIGTQDMTDFHPVRNSAGDLIIGSQLPAQYNASFGHLTFRGIIDNVTLYSRALTPEEVAHNYSLYS